jgi:LacI family kdg operon repressor
MVGLDNAAAAALGVRHLVERGFGEICFVVQPFNEVSSRRAREAAFREVLRAHPQVRGETVVLDLTDPPAIERALAALDARLGEGAGMGADRLALFAANGPVALCLARHLKERYGPSWQTRIALLSIDDPDWAELTGISAVRQPTYEIGYRAVEFLHERIAGGTTAARDCLLHGELIERASTSR